MGDLLGIGISGLKAQQTALGVTGHNIANAGTEGFSRQAVSFNENTPQFIGGQWSGSGVSVNSVKRVYDEFLTDQLQRDTSNFNQLDTLSINASQVDRLLADSGTGVQPGLERMFGSLQSVVDDPSSLAARQVLISEANGLVDRFSTINDRLIAQNNIINGQMKVIAEEVNILGNSIAELNEQIQIALASSNGKQPNDLMDQRERLITDLSKLVEVNTIEQDGSSINVFIGRGQGLVIGNSANELVIQSGLGDSSKMELYLNQGNSLQEINSQISGGQLGGMLEFRDQVLDPAIKKLDQIALSITETFNQQHRLGVDLEGLKGGNFFEDLNQPKNTYLRVQGDAQNKKPLDRLVSVHITDTSKLTTDDYRLEFQGPGNGSFKVFNDSTGEELTSASLTGTLPQALEIEGFEIRLEAGSFQQGDKFILSPTQGGTSQLAMRITRPEEIAIASPISTDAAIGNRGSGIVSQGSVYDINTPYLSSDGEMDPPLLIRFNSPTSYDVLDNTDPANPIPLFPPLMNQNYVSGVANSVLPGDEGKTAFTSFGGVLPAAPTYQAPATVPPLPPVPLVTATNGFFPERININITNPDTGAVTSQPLLITPENASAQDIAKLLSDRDGVEASARTTVQLSDFAQNPASFLPTGVALNGINITDTLGPSQTKYDSSYPQEVPDPITANFIADRINANYDFQKQGVVAKSDGDKVTITALNGEDLSFDISGDSSDGFTLSNGQDIAVVPTGAAPLNNLSEFEGYDFSQGGPYTYDLEVPGQGKFSIALTGDHANANDVKTEIATKIATEIATSGINYSGNIDVDIDERGNISFQSRLPVAGTGPNGSNKIAIGGEIKIVLDENYSLEIDPPGNNLFDTQPVGEPIHFGFELDIEGVVQAGDQFTVQFNKDGTSDSRNGVALGNLQTKDIINGNASFSDAYTGLVEEVGSITSRALTNRESSEVLLRNSSDAVESKSGVNLDEEAANLIRYELAYNASAKVIQVARDIFTTLINTF